MKFTTQEIAPIVSGRLTDSDHVRTVDGATQDSRSVGTGQLFVPLIADRDGHEFIDGAMAAGAAAYLTSGPTPVPGGIEVANTMDALHDLARAARHKVGGPVIGITGSVGKTSTKDLLAGAVSGFTRTHASVRSFNNEIGVPLTLLNAPDETEAVIVEMGSRGIGNVRDLCAVASPTVGIVTIVAPAHTGEFGSVENIATAKGELVESLPSSGLAVLNADNPFVSAMADRTDADILTFGMSRSATVHVRSIELDDELRATFLLDSQWGTVTARPPTRGAHMATNVAAAVGTALWLGASVAEVEAGLSSATVSPWRMEVAHTSTGALIINDAYNANPTSMRGALDSLSHLAHRRKVAVLGYMAELGDSEAADHLQIAAEARDAGAEVIAVGTDLYGSDPAASPLEAIGTTNADTAILIKGSRSAGLEVVAEALLNDDRSN